MLIMDNIILGLATVVLPANILALLIGTVIGLLIGALPGLSATMAIAILVPITFAFPPETGISMLAALYLSAMYGGSISAILIRTPGTPAAAATVLDGYPMGQQGKAGRALSISLGASFVGGVISSLCLLTVAPALGKVALEFGPVELAAVAALGMTIIASLSQESTVKGLIAGAAGLMLSTVGMDPITGSPRFTFGIIDLFSGIPFTVALIGLFSIPQVLRLLENDLGPAVIGIISDKVRPRWDVLRRLLPTILRSTGIGVFVGLTPGTGGDTACWFAYNEAKRFAPEEEKAKFGHGSDYGIAAPEAANNAVAAAALIPTISLGIPGSSATAVLLGGIMGHGIMPGPTLMVEHAKVAFTLIWAMFFANFTMYAIGLYITRRRLHHPCAGQGHGVGHHHLLRDRRIRHQQQLLRRIPDAHLRHSRLYHGQGEGAGRPPGGRPHSRPDAGRERTPGPDHQRRFLVDFFRVACRRHAPGPGRPVADERNRPFRRDQNMAEKVVCEVAQRTQGVPHHGKDDAWPDGRSSRRFGFEGSAGAGAGGKSLCSA